MSERMPDEDFEDAAHGAADGPRTQLCVAEARRARMSEAHLLSEIRVLREVLEGVNAGMDHSDDCAMATPGPAACDCPMRGARLALGLTPESRGPSDCKRAKEALG